MGVPTSEVGYNSATTRRGYHEVCMDMWWHWKKVAYVLTLLQRLTETKDVFIIIVNSALTATTLALIQHLFF
jgi:hypothetical protein